MNAGCSYANGAKPQSSAYSSHYEETPRAEKDVRGACLASPSNNCLLVTRYRYIILLVKLILMVIDSSVS
jgi:hypothetical protein